MSYAVFGHQEMEHCIRRRRSLKFKKRAVPVSELQFERELQFKCYYVLSTVLLVSARCNFLILVHWH